MLTVTTTRFVLPDSDSVTKEKVIRLFGIVICRWQERLATVQPQ